MQTTPAIPTGEPRKPSSINLHVPGPADVSAADGTPIALTVSRIRAVLVGSSGQTVTWTAYFGPNRDGTGKTAIITAGTTTTNITTGDIITVFDNPDIPPDSYIWVETTAKGGTVEWLLVTVEYA